MKKKILAFVFTSALILLQQQTFAQNLMNLDPTESQRFTVTEKSWPTEHGQAEVCLWKQDKLAAFTITIDDNPEMDVNFWKLLNIRFGFNFTWFVITEAPLDRLNVSDWNPFVELANDGHAIDGHDDKNWINGEENDSEEYVKRLNTTKDKIDSQMVGTPNKCRTYAYPYGDGSETDARKMFIAMRGVVGMLNNADKVNYLNVNSISSPSVVANPDTYILPLIDNTKTLYTTTYYRGWGSTHFHSLGSTALRNEASAFVQYLKNKEDKIWVSTFAEVAAYGQSRDTHELTVTNVTDNDVKFQLTDDMLDSYFDFPLTVKIMVANTWSDVYAVQGTDSIEAQIITHDNKNYVLVNAVPDAGEVVVSRKISSGINNELGDFNDKKTLANNVMLYPVPANGPLTVVLTGLQGKTNISVMSMQGQLIYKMQIPNIQQKHEHSISLSSGMYILKIENSKNTFTSKIII